VCLKCPMPATKTQEHAKPVPGGFTYSHLESALGRVFGADAAGQAGWLRGRIQHLRRLGLTPPTDRGPVVYTFEWAARWLLALRLERVGLNPADIVEFFRANWERKPGSKFPVKSLREVIEQARAPVEKARKAKTRYHSDDVWLIVTFDFHTEFPRIGLIQPYRKPHPKFDNAKGFFDYSRDDVVDVVAIPLTESFRMLETALQAVESKATEAKSEADLIRLRKRG
jgi:hypothetical protein